MDYFGRKVKYKIDSNGHICDPEMFGQIRYVIKDGEVRDASWLEKTVYIINGKYIEKPGYLFNETVFEIDGEYIKKPGWNGQNVYKVDSSGLIWELPYQDYSESESAPKASSASIDVEEREAKAKEDSFGSPSFTTRQPCGDPDTAAFALVVLQSGGMAVLFALPAILWSLFTGEPFWQKFLLMAPFFRVFSIAFAIVFLISLIAFFYFLWVED